MRSTSAAMICLAAGVLIGCGRSYHLPGHNEHNLSHPPDVVLRQGSRVLAVSTGLTLLPLVPAIMTSSDPDVVAVDIPFRNNRDTTYLVAKRPGTARLKYGWTPEYGGPPEHDASNVGFSVTVLPPDQMPKVMQRVKPGPR